jgi:hypothetical protein
MKIGFGGHTLVLHVLELRVDHRISHGGDRLTARAWGGGCIGELCVERTSSKGLLESKASGKKERTYLRNTVATGALGGGMRQGGGCRRGNGETGEKYRSRIV